MHKSALLVFPMQRRRPLSPRPEHGCADAAREKRSTTEASENQKQTNMTMAKRKTSDITLKAGPDRRCGVPEALQAASGRPASAFPITIAEWPRNGDELVRVRINRFNNSFTVDIRCWVHEGDGIFKPRRHGLTLGIKHLTKLDSALA
jgi:hypothetical protein